MIILLLHLLAWIPAVLGYGSVLLLVRKRISSIRGTEFEITEFWFGLILLATISSFWNFFLPVTATLSSVMLVIGWGLCWYRLSFLNVDRSRLILFFLWMIAVSFWCAQQPLNHDTGGYHYPSIRWANDNSLPFGLANLHVRFGYNSLWFPLAAILRLPFFEETGVHCFSVSALLVYFFGIAVWRAFASIRNKQTSVDNIFLSLSALMVLGRVFRLNISSPAPDFAILLLCVFVIYLALQMIENTSNWLYKCFQMVVLSVFGVAIKLSSLPLLLVPASLILLGFRKKIPIPVKQLAGYSFLFSGSIAAIWLARGIIQSGCLAFPIQYGCFENLSWTFPADTTALLTPTIKLVAQYAYQVPPKTHSAWEWIGPWFGKQLLFSIDFVLSMALLGGGFILFVFSRPIRKELIWIVLPLTLAILFWFYTAPDMRFGAGYLWSLSLLILSAAMLRGHAESTMKKILVVFLFSAVFVSVIPARSYLYFGLPPFRRAFRNVNEFLFVLPVPKTETTMRFNPDGIPIRLPVEGSDCWFAEIPCAPFFYEDLKIEKSVEGRFEKFYFP